MHELSLCRSIYRIVDRSRGDRPVEVVHLQVGRLRQVVPETLEHCWRLVTETTPLAGSRLDIDHVPVVLECSCGASTTVERDLMLTCPSCEGGEVTLRSGEELVVTSLDLLAVAGHHSAEA